MSVGMFADNVPFLSIFIAMIAAFVTPVLPCGNRMAEKVTCAVMAVLTLLSACLLFVLITEGRSFTYPMGAFPAPWGNELRAGPLEAMMALTFCVIMLLSLVGNQSSTARDISEERRPFFCALIDLLMSSLLAMVYTNDIFTAYVFIEINTIAACAVVAATQGREAVRAALRYMVMSLVGSGFILLSICLLYGLTGHLLMQNMHDAIQTLAQTGRYARPLAVSLNLIIIGLAVKSALDPFSAWLPDAHATATDAASAILSGLVLKGYIFLILKLCFRVFGPGVIHALHMDSELLYLGLLAMIMGSVYAIRQTNVKRMIAWSSVAQVGYIFLGIGLNTEAGAAAACFYIIVHAVVKPMLFTSVGGLIDVSGHKKELHDLRGSFYRNQWAGLGLIAGACSIMGIPLFAGFASKFVLTLASFESTAMIQALAVLVISTVLNALYYVPAVIVVMTPSPGAAMPPPRPRLLYRAAVALFMTLTFFLGLFCVPVMHVLELGVRLFG